MPQLLLELFSEEIPARMQAGAARDLERMVRERLGAADLTFDSLTTHVGPRRLALVIEGLPAGQANRTEELKGPRVGAPPQAMEGFLKKAGLTQDQLVERDGVYYANLSRNGRPTPEIVAEMVDAVVRGFPWPKSMRWGSGTLRWVRPLKRILCLFDGAVVPFDVDGIESGNVTEGHRFMGSDHAPFAVKDFADYRAKLAAHFVEIDAAARRAALLSKARELCKAEGLELVEDEGLADEVAGLVEHPVPLLGDMDPAFLDLPAEVIRTSMRTHQKYFAVRDPKTGGLAPRFLVVANVAPKDGGALVKAGNAKVLSARLSDARFFWDEDRREGNFAKWLEKLQGVTFHAKLGTMYQRVERITALAREIADLVGADPEMAAEAAKLSKIDLASGMVGEFPELQGIMGGYYAREFGLEPQIADAIRDHYKPQGPGDSVPTAKVSIAVALADKLDTLVGFFAIDEKPTGSKDPYALRRAALGAIRVLIVNAVRLPLIDVFSTAVDQVDAQIDAREIARKKAAGGDFVHARGIVGDGKSRQRDLLAFFADRLKVLLRDEGKRHDLVDAVFALGDDDLVRIVARVEALDGFLKSDDGANLLAGVKRATNILEAEQKKNPGEAYDGEPAAAAFSAPEEKALGAALDKALATLEPQLGSEDFAGAMTSLATLRAPVDAFFEHVLVNDPDAQVRLNRLRLLSKIGQAAGRVADFSLISG